jgi:4-carboxymuconolactone decarboxylase
MSTSGINPGAEITEAQRKAAMALLGTWDSQAMRDAQAAGNGDFAKEIGSIAFENVFARLWTRDGLDARSRSLLTLGILIALRAEDELRIHFQIAQANGLSREELEEVIYHATGYAGFPAAATARRVAIESMRAEGQID